MRGGFRLCAVASAGPLARFSSLPERRRFDRRHRGKGAGEPAIGGGGGGERRPAGGQPQSRNGCQYLDPAAATDLGFVATRQGIRPGRSSNNRFLPIKPTCPEKREQ